MRPARFLLAFVLSSILLFFTLSFQGLASAQAATTTVQTIQRDPQALAILQQSFATMGGSVPADSTTTGTVVLFEGASTCSGNISILTRGTEQSSEQIQTSQSTSAIIYSNLQANEISGSTSTPLSAELAASNRSAAFPLVIIASVLNNADSSFIYLGLGSMNGLSVHHIRYWNSFNSRPSLQFLAEFTLTDVWLDATSALPQRISQMRRSGRGSQPSSVVDIYFSNYQITSGIAHPLLVQKLLNGSPWMTITIASIAFNTGVSDANFPVQ